MDDEGPADLSVVICSLNGESRLGCCVDSVRRQRGQVKLDLIVVDDGSTDDTVAVAEARGARVVRHRQNLGVAAARNTGVRAARAEIVAFLDDDCEVPDRWAESVLRAFRAADSGMVAVSGPVLPAAPEGFMRGYLLRNPLQPLELDLARSPRIPYRFARYLVRAWTEPPAHARFVFSYAGASMSFRTSALREVGGFDADLRFGPEDVDVCIRLREQYGDLSLWFDPQVTVTHHYRPGLRDSLRRSHAYGRGHARLLSKYPLMRPTVFPLPPALIVLGLLGSRRRTTIALAILLPHLVHPRGIRQASQPAAILDAYITTLHEACFLVGAFGPGSGALSTLRARLGRSRRAQ